MPSDSDKRSDLHHVIDKKQREKRLQIVQLGIKIAIILTALIISYIYTYESIVYYYAFDYNVYQSIYNIPYLQWYTPETMYYYSPSFYILFYPLKFIPFSIYIILAFLFFLWGIAESIQKVDWKLWILMCVNVAVSFWFLLLHGNIDFFIFGILIHTWLYVKNEKIRGLIYGLCTFKGTIAYIFPLFLWKSEKRKEFVLFAAIGIFLNYFWLLTDISFFFAFIAQIQLPNHPTGQQYLYGFQYPWLWGILVLFINDLIEKIKKQKK